jgi:hypothetical protein
MSAIETLPENCPVLETMVVVSPRHLSCYLQVDIKNDAENH